MAKYSFTVSGSQLIVSLVPVLDDVQPTSMSYLAPSFKIGVGKINTYEYGQPRQSFLFTEIGEIDGVAPTDLQDAFDKLTTATANFNGGGAAPYKVYTALLTQSGTGAPVATVLENTTGLNITYQYLLVGKYAIYLNSPVPKNTVTIEMSNFRYGSTLGDDGIYFLEMVDDVANIGTYQLQTKFRTNAAATLTFANNALLNNKIEIRVYN